MVFRDYPGISGRVGSYMYMYMYAYRQQTKFTYKNLAVTEGHLRVRLVHSVETADLYIVWKHQTRTVHSVE